MLPTTDDIADELKRAFVDFESWTSREESDIDTSTKDFVGHLDELQGVRNSR